MKQKELAALCGVSESTVAKAFRDSWDLNADTKRMILGKADEVGYIYKANSSKRRRNVLVAIPEFKSEVYGNILAMIGRILDENDIYMCAFETRFDAGRLKKFLANKKSFFDGIIAEGWEQTSEIDKAIPERLPAVTTNADSTRFDSFSIDFVGTMRELIRRLKNSGHIRLAFVGDQLTRLREESFRAAIHADDPMFDDRYIIRSEMRFSQAGADGFEQLFALETPPDAVICAYDYIVFGLLDSAGNHGVRVPDDLSCVGIDNIRAAASYRLGVTTVDFKSESMYRAAVERLLARMDGDRSPVVKKMCDSEIVVRETAVI